MGNKTLEEIEGCVERPKCFLIKSALAFLLLVTFAFTLQADNAARNVTSGDLSDCTQMPLICSIWVIFFLLYINFYFLLTCYNWGQAKENIDICGCSFMPKIFTLAFVVLSIWTFVDFFQINSECKDYIKDTGSERFWFACQLLTICLACFFSFLIIFLIGALLFIFCCLITNEGESKWPVSIKRDQTPTKPLLTADEVWASLIFVLTVLKLVDEGRKAPRLSQLLTYCSESHPFSLLNFMLFSQNSQHYIYFISRLLTTSTDTLEAVKITRPYRTPSPIHLTFNPREQIFYI